jgi:hypothetical protein
MISPARFRLLAPALLLIAIACSKTTPPEQRVREFLDRAEQAAEQKDMRALRGAVSERYGDADGRDRRMIEGTLRLYVLRHESIHLFTRVESIEFPKPAEAHVAIYVAMAGRPITEAAQLAAFRANLYRFELVLADEDSEWRVVRASWRPADPGDFIVR